MSEIQRAKKMKQNKCEKKKLGMQSSLKMIVERNRKQNQKQKRT